MALSSSPTKPKPVSETTDDEAIEYLIDSLRRFPDPDTKIVFDEYTVSEMIYHLENCTPIGMQFLETHREVKGEEAEEAEKESSQKRIQAIQSAIHHLNAPSDS